MLFSFIKNITLIFLAVVQKINNNNSIIYDNKLTEVMSRVFRVKKSKVAVNSIERLDN